MKRTHSILDRKKFLASEKSSIFPGYYGDLGSNCSKSPFFAICIRGLFDQSIIKPAVLEYSIASVRGTIYVHSFSALHFLSDQFRQVRLDFSNVCCEGAIDPTIVKAQLFLSLPHPSNTFLYRMLSSIACIGSKTSAINIVGFNIKNLQPMSR